jgi:hypothetical protein
LKTELPPSHENAERGIAALSLAPWKTSNPLTARIPTITTPGCDKLVGARYKEAEAIKYKASPLQTSQISNFEQSKKAPPAMLLTAYVRLVEISTDALIDDKLDLL